MRSRAGITAVAASAAVLLSVMPAVATPLGDARSTPVDDPYYPHHGDANIDALRYNLDLTWRPRSGLHGLADLKVRSVIDQSSLQLDLSRHLSVSKVWVDGNLATFDHQGSILTIHTAALGSNSRHGVVVKYAGMPHVAPAPTTRSDIPSVGWKTYADGSVSAMQEPFGAFTWFPVNDHPSDKAYYRVRLNTPAKYVGVSGGTMTANRLDHGRRITSFELDEPAASYLVTVAINDYRRVTDRGPHNVHLTYWVRRHQDGSSLKLLQRSPNLLRWLQSQLGPYPFKNAGAVVVRSNSAMETQELVTMGSQRMKSRQNGLLDLLHEYAHQWYGDTVTPNNWPDLWMNEGFATYLQYEYAIHRGWTTRKHFLNFLRNYDGLFRSMYGPPGSYDKTEFGSGNVYYCAALMLYELRDRIGKDPFAHVLRAWPQQHQNQNVDRDDYIDWLNAETGRHLRPFITEWLTSPQTP